jgi:hypothetical protein
MKKRIAYLLLGIFVLTAPVVAQKGRISKADFHRTMQQIGDSLPAGWTVRSDTAFPNEILIQSQVMDLQPDMTSNDAGLMIEGQCEIFVLVLPRISLDSISMIRNSNKKLRDGLPPQNSKDNLKKWYAQNAQTLKRLDSEPTHYDDNYSYRIKCQRVPMVAEDRQQYNKIRSFLNHRFKKYMD